MVLISLKLYLWNTSFIRYIFMPFQVSFLENCRLKANLTNLVRTLTGTGTYVFVFACEVTYGAFHMEYLCAGSSALMVDDIYKAPRYALL